jgi:uncharacterized protein (DUF1330 family)
MGVAISTRGTTTSAHLITNVPVKNDTDFEEYRAKVPALVRKHGGEYLVRGGNFIVLEGDWKPSRLVILRFPTLPQYKIYSMTRNINHSRF